MRAGTEAALARVVRAFGAARPHHAYVFANRRANRLKVLVHDGIGVWLAARRLNQGRFVWTSDGAPSVSLTREQFGDFHLFAALLHDPGPVSERVGSPVRSGLDHMHSAPEVEECDARMTSAAERGHFAEGAMKVVPVILRYRAARRELVLECVLEGVALRLQLKDGQPTDPAVRVSNCQSAVPIDRCAVVAEQRVAGCHAMASVVASATSDMTTASLVVVAFAL